MREEERKGANIMEGELVQVHCMHVGIIIVKSPHIINV
jgi:hypothetical protein